VWLTSDGATGKAANGRDIYINTDGSVRGQSSTTYAGYQRIGTGLDLSAAGTSNGPNIMLQIAI
jgi:type II secretory pathway component GspD/PulD (secretin)